MYEYLPYVGLLGPVTIAIVTLAIACGLKMHRVKSGHNFHERKISGSRPVAVPGL